MRKFEPVKFVKGDSTYNPADVVLPKRGTKYSAGYDFVAPKTIKLPAYTKSNIIPLNVKVRMPKDEYLQLTARSSLGCKFGVSLAQGVGIIDADYYGNPDNDGNIGVCFVNNTEKDHVIAKGDRCVQGIFQKYYVTDDDNADGERNGGYGSTGRS